jgi:rSAM/selenodomain-associated transferase 2
MTKPTGSSGAFRISIIIPTLNEEDQIADLLNALKEKESSGGYIYEIIVADGGSSDGTVTLAEHAGARIVHCSEKGRARQMNKGADEASAEILYFLHADTFPPEAFDRSIVKAIKSGAGAGCFQLRFSNNHPLLRFYGWCTRFKSTLVRFGDQSLFVKKEIFSQLGGFDERLVVMEDQKMVGNLKNSTSFRLVDRAVTTSARTYEKNGVIRLQFIFTMIVILYYCGAKQDTLVHLYNSLIEL